MPNVETAQGGEPDAASASGDVRVDLLVAALRRLPEAARSLVTKRRRARPVVAVNDEYDAQDFVEMVARLLFPDIRREEPAPSFAGSGSRLDFLVADAGLAIEVKVTRARRTAGRIRDELVIDQRTYSTHPQVRHLITVVYDLSNTISNPANLEAELSRPVDHLLCTTLVVRWPRPPAEEHDSGKGRRRGAADASSGSPERTLGAQSLRTGIREVLADPPFTRPVTSDPYLVLRAAARFRPPSQLAAMPNAVFNTLPGMIPVDSLERWMAHFAPRREGGSAVGIARRDGTASNASLAVATRSLNGGSAPAPDVAVRAAVLLPGMLCSEVRFVVDLWIAAQSPVPLEMAVASLRDGALLAVDGLARWFDGLSGATPPKAFEALEVHAEAVTVEGSQLGQTPLGAVLDLSPLGPHEGRDAWAFAAVDMPTSIDPDGVGAFIQKAIELQALNWGYFEIPEGQMARMLRVKAQ